MKSEITELLNYRPNARPFKSGKERIPVAWPMLAYRVIAPKPKDRKLNLFEEVILKLCDVGISTVDLLSRKIPIDKDLIAYILIQMKEGKGLIDDEGKLTQVGKRFLDELDVEPEMVMGYVFRDGLSGNMLPYFTEGQLFPATIKDQYHDKKIDIDILRVDVGTENKPREYSLKVIKANPDITYDHPYPREVLRSIKMYNKKKMAYNRSVNKRAYEGALISDDDELYWLEQINVQNIDPKEVYMYTYIFIPDDKAKSSFWQICDPFGFGISMQFRTVLETYLQASSLAPVLDEFVQKVHDVRDFEIEDYQKEQKKIGEKDVLSLFGENVIKHPMLYKALLDENKAWRQSNRDSESNADQKNKETNVEQWYRNAYSVLETGLKELNEKIPAHGSFELISKTPIDNADRITKLANKIGFKVDDEFTKVMKLQKYQIERAKYGTAKDLQSLMAYALISANDNSFHPLYELAKKNKEFMDFVLVLKELRDTSSHAARHDSYQMFEEERKNILEFIYISFPDLIVGDKKRENVQSVDTIKIERKIRNLAEINTMKELEKINLNELDGSLKFRLVNMEYQYILEDRDASSSYSETAMEGIRCMEELLKYWHHRTHRYTNSLEDPFGIAIEKIKKTKLVLEENDIFPEPLISTNKNKIVSSVKYSSGTLGSLLIAYIIKAEESVLMEMSSRDPNLLYKFNEVIKSRGHGPSCINMNKETIQVFRDNIYSIMKLA